MEARGEGQHVDLKANIDIESAKSKLELVKDVVSFANSGGGEIRFGFTESTTPGLEKDVVDWLDSARVMDLVQKYTKPARVDLDHEVSPTGSGRQTVVIRIRKVDKYPIVFEQDGQYQPTTGRKNKNLTVFRKGDLYFRHGSKSEPCKYQDLVDFIDRSRQNFVESFQDFVNQLARVPHGTPVLLTPDGDTLANPSMYIDLTLARRRVSRGALLSGEDLLWAYTERPSFKPKPEQLELLVRSALRRKPTLYWWLSEPDATSSMVKSVLFDSLRDTDRDKSDAAWTILEVGSFYLDEEEMGRLVDELKESRYSHFKKAAKAWTGREEYLDAFIGLVGCTAPSADDSQTPEHHLLDLGAELAQSILGTPGKPVAAVSTRLGKCGKTLWFHRQKARKDAYVFKKNLLPISSV